MSRKSKEATPKSPQTKSNEPPPRPPKKTPEPEHHDTLAGTGMDQEPTR